MTSNTPAPTPDERFTAILQLTESNARAIAALTARTAETEALAERRTTEHEERMDVAERQIALLTELQTTTYQTQQQLIETINQLSTSVQNLIDDALTDRTEAQRQREANAQEHAAFQEHFQSLLLSFTEEIRQIWQRLSA